MAQFPYINGYLFSYASAQFEFMGDTFYGVKGYNYSEEVKQENEYGPAPAPLGLVLGPWTGTHDVEVIRSEGDRLVARLGNNYSKVPFDSRAEWEELTGAGRSVIEIPSVRISKIESSNASGVATYKITLACTVPFKLNGFTMIERLQAQAGSVSGVVGAAISAAASFSI